MNSPVKLKNGDIKKVRLELLEKQDFKCAICGFEVTIDQAVLDHDHKPPGHIRAVLHRSCNSLLGKNENNAPRYGLKFDQLLAFLIGAAKYIDLHKTNQSGLIHPTFFTVEEKIAKKKAKAAAIKAKKLSDKAKALKLKKKLDDKSPLVTAANKPI